MITAELKGEGAMVRAAEGGGYDNSLRVRGL